MQDLKRWTLSTEVSPGIGETISASLSEIESYMRNFKGYVTSINGRYMAMDLNQKA